MKAINKLNESLKYNSKVNNRNVVAAICAQEFNKLRDYVTNHAEDELLDHLITVSHREMISDTPMKLFQINEIMPAYKLRNGKPCKMKVCDCSCAPSDGSITIAKLAEETIDLIIETSSGSGAISQVAEPILSVNWINVDTKEMSDSLNMTAEIGTTYQWEGYYKWYKGNNQLSPYKIESNVFSSIPSEGVNSDTVTVTTSKDTTFTLTLIAPNNHKSTVTSSITFRYPIYYGVKGKSLTKQLTNDNTNTIKNVSLNSDEYFVYKYSKTFPKLESIIMNDAFNVIQAFEYSEESFVSDTGQNMTLRVYTSANPGAFTNAKLSFK